MKEEREVLKKQRAYQKMLNKDVKERQALQEMSEEEREEYIQQRLEHNLQVLAALEEEYERENNRREDLNNRLEAEGFNTIEEKLNALKEKYGERVAAEGHAEGVEVNADEVKEALQIKSSKSKGFGLGGSAECRVVPNEESQE